MGIDTINHMGGSLMATYTDNLNLKKPAPTDLALISDINGNMDILDLAVDARVPKTDVVGEIMGSVSTMPTASADLEGRVVCYTGTTTADYIQDAFYKCVETATDTYGWIEVFPGEVYEWEQLDPSNLPTDFKAEDVLMVNVAVGAESGSAVVANNHNPVLLRIRNNYTNYGGTIVSFTLGSPCTVTEVTDVQKVQNWNNATGTTNLLGIRISTIANGNATTVLDHLITRATFGTYVKKIWRLKKIKPWTGDVVDDALDGTSDNPVQNKVVTQALNGKQDSLPATIGNSGKVLAVNSAGTGLEWVTQVKRTVISCTTFTQLYNAMVSCNMGDLVVINTLNNSTKNTSIGYGTYTCASPSDQENKWFSGMNATGKGNGTDNRLITSLLCDTTNANIQVRPLTTFPAGIASIAFESTDTYSSFTAVVIKYE